MELYESCLICLVSCLVIFLNLFAIFFLFERISMGLHNDINQFDIIDRDDILH